MRRLGLAWAVLVLVAATAASAPAGERAAALGPVTCGTAKQFTYLFWPQGHQAIPSINFPAFPVPHLELYKGFDPTFPNPGLAAAVNAQAGGGFAPGCAKAKVGHAAPISHPKTTTATGELQCTFPRPPVQTILKAAGGFVLQTIEPPKAGSTSKPTVVASATIKPTGSTLLFDPMPCKLIAAPKPPPLMRFTYQGLAASFTGQGGTAWSVGFSGTNCGSDVRGPWAMTQTLSLNGSQVGQPLQRAVDLTSGAGGFTILKSSDGSGSADAQFQLSPAAPTTITLGITLGGNYSGASVSAAQAQVTATPVASC
jgi:hypothetical protein